MTTTVKESDCVLCCVVLYVVPVLVILMVRCSSLDRCFPALLKTLRSQRVVYVCCGEDHTAALTKVDLHHVCVGFLLFINSFLSFMFFNFHSFTCRSNSTLNSVKLITCCMSVLLKIVYFSERNVLCSNIVIVRLERWVTPLTVMSVVLISLHTCVVLCYCVGGRCVHIWSWRLRSAGTQQHKS